MKALASQSRSFRVPSEDLHGSFSPAAKLRVNSLEAKPLLLCKPVSFPQHIPQHIPLGAGAPKGWLGIPSDFTEKLTVL